MGFCRTNLFKRLESAGPAFHPVHRASHSCVISSFLHAVENGLDIPLGTQGAELLDTRHYDEDPDGLLADDNGDEVTLLIRPPLTVCAPSPTIEHAPPRRMRLTAATLKSRFKWLPGTLFIKALAKDLLDGCADPCSSS